MSGGSNGPDVIVNGGVNDYDRPIAFDAPVAFDTGLVVQQSDTLATLRDKLKAGLGMASQNLTAGATTQFNLWLQLAQSQQYWRYPCLRTERWWPWQLEAGKRFYDVPVDGLTALNFRKLTGAWIADNGGIAVTPWAPSTAFALNAIATPLTANGLHYQATVAGSTGASEPTWPTTAGDTVVDGTVTWTAIEPLEATWYKLEQGIDPVRFSSSDSAMPDSFEVREYLELWPAPDQPYVVWLRGHLGLKRFTQDSDEATIDPDVILLFALALAKAHYRHPDAGNYAQMAARMGAELTGGSHGLRRYRVTPATTGMKLGAHSAELPQPRATWRTG